VLQTDVSGNESWIEILDLNGLSGTMATSMNQGYDGSFTLVGAASIPEDVWIVNFDTYAGLGYHYEWHNTFGGDDYEEGNAVVQTEDLGYIIAGKKNTGRMTDAWIVKTDQEGNYEWDKTIGGSKYDHAYDVILSNDGGYVFAGVSDSYGSGNDDFWVVKTDVDGNAPLAQSITQSGQQ